VADEHEHQHGPDCGHTAIHHDDHVDHLHDGELHHHGDSGVERHAIGDHVDDLVGGHLHHPHDDHCDDHGPVKIANEG
jgi:hypothetical protein